GAVAPSGAAKRGEDKDDHHEEGETWGLRTALWSRPGRTWPPSWHWHAGPSTHGSVTAPNAPCRTRIVSLVSAKWEIRLLQSSESSTTTKRLLLTPSRNTRSKRGYSPTTTECRRGSTRSYSPPVAPR